MGIAKVRETKTEKEREGKDGSYATSEEELENHTKLDFK